MTIHDHVRTQDGKVDLGSRCKITKTGEVLSSSGKSFWIPQSLAFPEIVLFFFVGGDIHQCQNRVVFSVQHPSMCCFSGVHHCIELYFIVMGLPSGTASLND